MYEFSPANNQPPRLSTAIHWPVCKQHLAAAWPKIIRTTNPESAPKPAQPACLYGDPPRAYSHSNCPVRRDGAQNILIQNMGNADSAYDLHLQCKIIFELDQQQIAHSIRYEGKAC